MKKLTLYFIISCLLVFVLGVFSVNATTAQFTVPAAAYPAVLDGYSTDGFTFHGDWANRGYDSRNAPFMEFWDRTHSITFNAGTFTFNAISLGGWPWDNYGGSPGGTLTMNFKGISGNVIAERSIYLPWGNSFVTFSENISGVHEIFFPAAGDSFWPRLDSITYVTNPVPEPATMLLIGLGLMGLAGIRRKMK